MFTLCLWIKFFFLKRSFLQPHIITLFRLTQEKGMHNVFYTNETVKAGGINLSLFFFLKDCFTTSYCVEIILSLTTQGVLTRQPLQRGMGLCVCLYFGKCLLTCMNTPPSSCVYWFIWISLLHLFIFNVFVCLRCIYCCFILCRPWPWWTASTSCSAVQTVWRWAENQSEYKHKPEQRMGTSAMWIYSYWWESPSGRALKKEQVSCLRFLFILFFFFCSLSTFN